ncbi:MAG TPA: tRNA lysidine(34) synthetase TilS [Anaeromyxobacteraceae bacterium]|nr:tRNA lysidine(34) synthetase TilS [Anaeromyxobacteraceae bacterium]
MSRPPGAEFTALVGATCSARGLIASEDVVLAALSGGADSTALVGALSELRDAGRIRSVRALHVDHGLRRGVERDREACERTCAALGVPLRCVRVEVGRGNVQQEARRARYAALREEADRVGATRIATGHTQDDQAETVLLRLLRGAGARGLSGIPPRRGRIVRPLIDRSRAEVMAFLAARGLSHVEDPTNGTPRFQRNRLRREALPALRALAPRVDRAIARTADLLRDDERALAARAREAAAGGEARGETLLAEPVAVRRRAVRELWRQATGSRRGLDAAHVERVLALLGRRGPGRAPLPGGREAVLRYGALSIRARTSPAAPPEPVSIPRPGRYPLPGGEVLEVEAEGDDAVAWPLSLRGRMPGDRFRPAGGRGSKKLKAWLIDRKVPREDRDGLRVLADAEGWVLWIPALGVRAGKPSVRARLRR